MAASDAAVAATAAARGAPASREAALQAGVAVQQLAAAEVQAEAAADELEAAQVACERAAEGRLEFDAAEAEAEGGFAAPPSPPAPLTVAVLQARVEGAGGASRAQAAGAAATAAAVGDAAEPAGRQRAGARRSAPPTVAVKNNLHGLYLFAGSGSAALAFLCICVCVLFYVDISSAAQSMLSLAMAAKLIPVAPVIHDIRGMFDSKQFRDAVAAVRRVGGDMFWHAGWPCQVCSHRWQQALERD